MRFLICSKPPGLPPGSVPVADFAHEVGRNLAARGHSVLMAYSWRLPTPEERLWLRQGGLAWRNWATGSETGPGHLFPMLRVMRDFGPDAVDLHFSSVPFGLLAASLLRVRCRVAWYHTAVASVAINSGGPGLRISLRVFRAGIYRRLAHAHVTNSGFSRREYAALFGIPLDKIRVQYLGVPLPDAQAASAREARLLVCVGRLAPAKGQEVLLGAMDRLAARFPDLRAVFAGEGDPAVLGRALAGLEGRCQFLGPVPRREVYRLYGRGNVAVFPTRAEALGLAAIEALACGIPLVASAVGGLPEVLEDGRSGILVPPGDESALADAIGRLLDSDRLCEELRRRGLERARFFDLQRRAAEYADWLSREAAGRNSGL